MRSNRLADERQILHRIVKDGDPSEADFQPTEPQANDSAEVKRLRAGVSMYATVAQARAKARALPWLGAWVAAVDVTDVPHERTTSSRGHHTVWAHPSALANRVIAVHDVYE
jgi:hypothetical protein